MKTKEVAVRNYQAGVSRIGGASTYFGCGERSAQGFMAVASCLHDAKKAAGLEAWVSAYAQAA